jgi:predicted chitinase
MSNIDTRKPGKKIGVGPYIGIVTNHLDTTYMGMLEVTLLKGTTGSAERSGTQVTVRHLSPFAGATNIDFEGNNSAAFNDVQKSYGMWMIPPDIGTTVLCIFIDGDSNAGYWMGCIQDTFQNHMIPGIAASKYTEMTPEQQQKYGTNYLPVAEFHKKSRTLEIPKPSTFGKPVHPFADRLVTQGLLLDTVRGVTSSSARREVPSQVYGISTPGPVDISINAPRHNIGIEKSVRAPVSRLGGTTFVMDDGDRDGKNELVRIRTRTGHQILLHNTADLIYIGNAKGTAWLEMTSQGKIDIFAQDSVSIHSEQDFNFRADRDINFEAGRNIHIRAGGVMETNVAKQYYLLAGADGKLQFQGNYNLSAGAGIRQQATAKTSIVSGGNLVVSSNANISIGATGVQKIVGKQLLLNSVATDGSTAPDQPKPLEIFSLPNRSGQSGWGNNKFYKDSDIQSIMQRVPTHEPWDHHENINPSMFTAANTDTQVNQPTDAPSNPTAAGGTVPVNANPIGKPLGKNAGANEAFLKQTLINAGVTNPIKLAAIMAQCKHESGGFIYLREIASGKDYEGRTDLGNTQPGDGVRYKGRGFIQITGRTLYQAMTKYFGQDVVAQPELVEQIELASKSVIFFFTKFKTKGFKNATMTQPYTDTDKFWDDVLSVSALVNGGTNGLADRQVQYAYYKNLYTTQGIGTAGNTTSAVPANAIRTGSGGVLTDSSGKPVTSGS